MRLIVGSIRPPSQEETVAGGKKTPSRMIQFKNQRAFPDCPLYLSDCKQEFNSDQTKWNFFFFFKLTN